MTRRALPFLAVAVAALLAACGGGPSSPSGSGGVSVKGQVLGAGASTGVTASSGAAAASSGKITVTVAGTGLSTTVSSSGTFELEGVTGGAFTLVFWSDGVEIGRVQITTGASADVKIVVQVQSSTIVVVELEVEDKDPDAAKTAAACFISGGNVGQGIELEGRVASGSDTAFAMEVNGERAGLVNVAASASAYKCNGGGKNALTDAQCRATLVAGARVHVRGTLTTCTTSSGTVTASEVKLQ